MNLPKPRTWNGIPVPYDARLDELRSYLRLPGPRAWAACQALAHRPSRNAYGILLELTTSADWRYRRSAIEALSVHRLGGESRQVICACFQDPSPYVVRAACEAVAGMKLHEAHGSVFGLLSSKDARLRTAALRALEKIWEDSDFEAVLSAFRKDPATEARRQSAWTLANNASPENWQKLFEAWKDDPIPRHRVWACNLAEEFGDFRFRDPLLGLTEDKDGHVRKAARRALTKI